MPQPLILFGTEEQKRKYLPRVAKGEISAFALTEAGVGSDPATMETHAEPTPDGKYFILNGEKLWCTNGTKAGVIVVMAKTPPKMVNGKAKKQITAFIVEMDTPGRGGDSSLPFHGPARALQRRGSIQRTFASRAKTSCSPKAKAARSRSRH